MTLFNGIVDGGEGVFIVVLMLGFVAFFIHSDHKEKMATKRFEERWENRHQSWHVQGVELKLRWIEKHSDGSIHLVLQEFDGYESELKRVIVGSKQ